METRKENILANIQQIIQYKVYIIINFRFLKIMKIIALILALPLLCFSSSPQNSWEKYSPICQVCHNIAILIQKSLPTKSIDTILQKIAVPYCLKNNGYDRQVCTGTIQAMSIYVLQNGWKHLTNPHQFCHKVRLCPQQYDIRKLEDDITKIVKDKPNKKWQKPTLRRKLKIMHVSDLHPDLFYTVGAQANCSQPVCCRPKNNTYTFESQWQKFLNKQISFSSQQNISQKAGYWGSIASCQLPFQTFELFLTNLRKMNLDLILWTGDNTPHDIWKQTQQYNLNYTLILAQMIANATNTTVIPTMGNHQSWPVNVYDFNSDRQRMFLSGLNSVWKIWLDPEAQQSLSKNGFYAQTIPEMNNLRVISLNTQAGNDKNWFLLNDPTDPGSMLKWLQTELKAAEEKGYYVWIIGHVHPKSSVNQWSMRYSALVDRFSYVIRGQFYGHTHVDHINFFPSFVQKDTLSGYYMISPSLTTATFKNPQYRLLQIDYDTLQVLDYHQLNLSSNPTKQDNPNFQLFYSFKDAYNLTDMQLSGGITQLKSKLQKQKSYQQKYSYLMYGGLHAPKSGRSVYCDTTTSPQFHQQCMDKKYKPSQFQKFAGPWKYLRHSE